MRDVTLKDIAQDLKRKKALREPPILVLGSRTGLFYGHEELYEYASKACKAPDAFSTASSPKKFQECYRVLNERLSSGEVDELLRAYLGGQPEVRAEDVCMAELINEGYFDVVISTTIDPLLQDSLNHQRMLQDPIPSATKFLLYDDRSIEAITMPYAKNTIKVIKIFGDLETRKYHTVHNSLNIDSEANEKLKRYMQELFARPVFIIGFDPEWDRPLENVFRMEGGDIFYINEEEPGEQSHMAELLQKRNGRVLIGGKSKYDTFLWDLHHEIFPDGPLSFKLVQKLLLHLKTLQVNTRNRDEEHKAQIEEVLHVVQTLQQDIGDLQGRIVSLQESVQRLLATDTYERKDD